MDQIKCTSDTLSFFKIENQNEYMQIRKRGRYITKHTCASKAFVTALHTSRRYFSRYLGKSVAKDDCSVNAPALLSEA